MSNEQAKTLDELLKASVSRHRGLVELHNLYSTASSNPNQPPLIERLHQYPEGSSVDLSNLVSYPPKIQPIPVKPILLDVAWNYIEYPGQAKQAAPTAAKAVAEPEKGTEGEKKETKRGWFGFGRS